MCKSFYLAQLLTVSCISILQESPILQTNRATRLDVKFTNHGTILCVRYGFLLMFYSTGNLVPKMHHFWHIRLQTCRDLENRVRGPSRSLKKCHNSIACIWLPINVP